MNESVHENFEHPNMSGTRFSIEVQPIVSKVLSRLEELANDLKYTWSRPICMLFAQLDRDELRDPYFCAEFGFHDKLLTRRFETGLMLWV